MAEKCVGFQDSQPRKNSVEFGKKCPNQRSHMEKHYASSNRQVGKLSICTYHIMYKYITISIEPKQKVAETYAIQSIMHHIHLPFHI